MLRRLWSLISVACDVVYWRYLMLYSIGVAHVVEVEPVMEALRRAWWMALYSVSVTHIVEVESVHGGVKGRLILAQLAFDPHLVAHDAEDDGYDGDQHQPWAQHQRQDPCNKQCYCNGMGLSVP